MTKKPKSPLPPRWFARLVLVLSGVVWVAVAVAGLLDARWLADMADFELTSTTAHNEFRAMYGGLTAAIAALHFIAAIRSTWLVQALWASLLLDVGLTAGRFVSLATDGIPGPVGLGLMFGEWALIGLCGVALWRLRGSVASGRDTLGNGGDDKATGDEVGDSVAVDDGSAGVG